MQRVYPPTLLALLTVSLVACGTDRGEMDFDFTASAGTQGTASTTSAGTTTDTTAGTTSVGTTGETTGETTAGTTGETTTGEPPLQCDFAVGCHMPTEPASNIGYASHVPAGCGGGTFAPAFVAPVHNYADPEAPRAIPFVGDFDGDGAEDLLVNFRKSSGAFVFPGTGTGSFVSQPITLAGGLFAGGWGGDLGDINGDGSLDILLGDHTRSGRAWTSNGPSFTEARSGLPDNIWFSGGGLADFNGDGNLDAIFGKDQFASGFELYQGGGNGTWTQGTAPPTMGSNLGYFAFNDFDDDGDVDIFAFGKGGSPIDAFVFRNDTGSFAFVAQLSGGGGQHGGANPVQGSVGDINCDGQADVAVGGTIYLREGNSWTQVTEVDPSIISHLADMNGDGNLDLVTQDRTVGLALYYGDGTGTGWDRELSANLPDETYEQFGGTLTEAYGIDVGDFDGNGHLDIVRIGGFLDAWLVEAWVR